MKISLPQSQHLFYLVTEYNRAKLDFDNYRRHVSDQCLDYPTTQDTLD